MSILSNILVGLYLQEIGPNSAQMALKIYIFIFACNWKSRGDVSCRFCSCRDSKMDIPEPGSLHQWNSIASAIDKAGLITMSTNNAKCLLPLDASQKFSVNTSFYLNDPYSFPSISRKSSLNVLIQAEEQII